MLNKKLLDLARKNIDKEVLNICMEDIFVRWQKEYALSKYNNFDSYTFNKNEIHMSEHNLKEYLSEKFNVDIDDVDIYYQGYIGFYINGHEHILRFYEDCGGLYSVTGEVIDFLDSTDLKRSKEIEIKTSELYSTYNEKNNWIDNSKQYCDNHYISIVRDYDIEEGLKFDSVFDYILENHIEFCHTIYPLNTNVKAMYISKDSLLKIKSLDIPATLKENIDEIISKGHCCELCNNTTYVNTVPYTYYNNHGCTGRLYSYPLCLSVNNADLYPNYNLIKTLNGDEKLELILYARRNLEDIYIK